MNQSVKIERGLLIKNTSLNFIGYLIPLILALVTIPYIIRGLGVERFGILSLVWVVFGYFGMFDLGLGRATTRFVADALGKGETDKISDILWTSIIFQTVLGIIGGIVLIAITPLLVEKILHIPPFIVEETKITFYLLSISIPVVMYTGSLRGVLEAAQRFDLVNAVKVPVTSLAFLIPAIAILLGFKLPGIMLLLTVSWFIAGLVYFIVVLKVFPKIKMTFSVKMSMFRTLLTYGGWITFCNLFVPVLLYVDRFFITILGSIAALGYYTVPYEVVSRASVIRTSFATTLFPAFSALGVDREKLRRLYAHSLKYLLLTMGPIALVLIIFAGDILRIWIGSDFADKSTLVFQILAIGMLLNSLATLSAYLLDGIGRPDLRAKIYLSYFAVYIVLAWFLIGKMGIVGAALAWTLRALLELILFFIVSCKVMHCKFTLFVQNGFIKAGIAYIALVIVLSFTSIVLGKSTLNQLIAAGGAVLTFALVVWRFVLDDTDRNSLLAVIRKK